MDARLKEWIIKKNDEATGSNAMTHFIHLLKNNPGAVLDVIYMNIHGWAIACMTELKIDLEFSNDRAECQDLLTAMQKHYAKQLVEIDKPKIPMNLGFKQWICSYYEEFSAFEKKILLRLLKHEPEKIFIDIPRLASKCSMELRIDILYNDNVAEREEILQQLREHFASQLAEIA